MSLLTFFAERKSTVVVGVIVIAGAIGITEVMTHTSREPPPKPKPPVVMVLIKPTPPPPPPPPIQQPKTIAPPKMATPVAKPVVQNTPPKAAPPKAPGPAETHIGTSIRGPGSNAFDLSGDPGGNGMFSGGGGGGDAVAYYESQVQTIIQQALQKNPITRKATAGLRVSISVDATGAVTAVQLDKSSGDAAVDQAIVDDILRRSHFPPPPSGQPATMAMSLTGEQPL
jgi:TonB family protein